jgi:hypothetical protein
VELQVLDLEVLGVERADDLGQIGLARLQADCDTLEGSAGLAEAGKDPCGVLLVLPVDGDDLDGRAADLGLQLGGSALGDDLAVVDDPDPVGQHVRLLEVLGGEEHGDPVVLGKAAHLLPECAPALRVEAGGRLVQEEDPGRVDERESQIEPALHPTGVAADLAVGRLREPHALEQKVTAPGALRTRDSLQRRLQPQVLPAREERVESRLLERGSNRGPDLRPFADDVVAGHGRRPLGGRKQRREHVHGRRLPRPVRPEETVDLTGMNDEVDPVHRARSFLELANEPARDDPMLVSHGCRLVV